MAREGSPSEDELTAQRRAAVADVVWARMTELGLSLTGLAELSGLAFNTVKGVIGATGNPAHKSTLVALSAVLGWSPHFLDGIASGRAAGDATSEMMLHALLANLAGELRTDIARLSEDVRQLDEKISRLIELATRQG